MKLWLAKVPPSLQERAVALDASLAQEHAADSGRRWVLELLRHDGAALLRLLWRALGHQQDVLDAYQECFCRLIALDRQAEKTPPRAYAFQTALNIARDMRRRRKVRADHLMPFATQQREPSALAMTPRPSYVELMEHLRTAIDALPDRLRDVILLRDLGEMNYKDTARVLGLTPGTARVYRREAIQRLAAALRETWADD